MSVYVGTIGRCGWTVAVANIEFPSAKTCVVTANVFSYAKYPASYERDENYIIMETDTSDFFF
jgi:hypothetical protein